MKIEDWRCDLKVKMKCARLLIFGGVTNLHDAAAAAAEMMSAVMMSHIISSRRSPAIRRRLLAFDDQRASEYMYMYFFKGS